MAAFQRPSITKVFIVEDHDEALKHIYRSIGSKHIPYVIPGFLHLDSHPDLLLPEDYVFKKMRADREYLESRLSIESWILPAVASGHLPSITWIKPPWANQIKTGTYSFLIGENKETGFVRLSCKEPYFVAEQLYCLEEKLENTVKVTLDVQQISAETNLYPIMPKHYILDIDLDFYSTLNPFLVYFKPEVFQLINKLYHWEITPGITEEEQAEERKKQLTLIKSLIDRLEKGENIENLPPSEERDSLQKILKLLPKPDWEMFHTAGQTCDFQPLPHHPSTEKEIDELIQSTARLLKAQNASPLLITIARSSLDEYCPQEIVDSIQAKVIDMLKQVFTDKLNVIEVYKE